MVWRALPTAEGRGTCSATQATIDLLRPGASPYDVDPSAENAFMRIERVPPKSRRSFGFTGASTPAGWRSCDSPTSGSRSVPAVNRDPVETVVDRVFVRAGTGRRRSLSKRLRTAHRAVANELWASWSIPPPGKMPTRLTRGRLPRRSFTPGRPEPRAILAATRGQGAATQRSRQPGCHPRRPSPSTRVPGRGSLVGPEPVSGAACATASLRSDSGGATVPLAGRWPTTVTASSRRLQDPSDAALSAPTDTTNTNNRDETSTHRLPGPRPPKAP